MKIDIAEVNGGPLVITKVVGLTCARRNKWNGAGVNENFIRYRIAKDGGDIN